jgi:hypothetical protein
MGPEVAALAFAAAATGVSAYGYVSERNAANSQYKMDEAAIELQRQQAHYQAAEQANASAGGFRKALASQVALASMRGGSGSLVRQFGGESYSNFLKDQEAIKRGGKLIDVQALNQTAQAKANRSSRKTNAALGAISSSINAWNVNNLTQAKLKGPK